MAKTRDEMSSANFRGALAAHLAVWHSATDADCSEAAEWRRKAIADMTDRQRQLLAAFAGSLEALCTRRASGQIVIDG